MKKNLHSRTSALFSFIAVALMILIPSTSAFALSFKTPHVENASEPNILRNSPLKYPTHSKTQAQSQSAPSASSAAVTQSSLGPNLIQNPSLEVAGAGGVPANWRKGGYGTNTRTLTYPVVGTGGSGTKAESVTVSGYTSGDAKWYPDEVSVTPGMTYQFSDAYTSSVPSIVEIRFTLSGGTFSYKDIATPAASSAFTAVTGQFTAPTNAVSATIFHLLNQNGTLVTDDYSLQEVTLTNNLMQNGDFEVAGTGGLPAHWIKGGYGNNTRTLTYPVVGESGNGAQITVSNYVSGDVKWAPDPSPLSPGTYTYSDSYKSNAPTYLTAEFARSDGSLFYADLKSLPAASAWTQISANFTLPVDAVSARVFHLLKSNGTLTLDNTSIVSAAGSNSGIFATGAITFRFDDNFKDQYTVAAPILDAAGFKATFYVVSQQIADTGFPGYMSEVQVKDLASRGYEIGAHTRTHPHLTTLSTSQQQSEISGSRQDLLSWNVGPVLSFAYPFGEYDANTISIVQSAGFSSAGATISGYVTPSSDHYQLEYQEPHNDTSLAQIEQWIDTAQQTHTWLILTLHDVVDNGGTYTITPSMLQSIVNYVKQKNLPVVTTSQGMQSM